MRERVRERGGLQRVEFEARLVLRPLDSGVDLDGGQAGGDGAEAVDDLGDLAFGAVVGGQLQEGLRIASIL